MNKNLLFHNPLEENDILSVSPHSSGRFHFIERGSATYFTVPITVIYTLATQLCSSVAWNATPFTNILADELCEETNGLLTIEQNVSLQTKLLRQGSSSIFLDVDFLNRKKVLLKRALIGIVPYHLSSGRWVGNAFHAQISQNRWTWRLMSVSSAQRWLSRNAMTFKFLAAKRSLELCKPTTSG